MRRKLLHVMMGTHNPDFVRGLDSVFDCIHFDWTVFSNDTPSHIPHLAHLSTPKSNLNSELLSAFNNFKPDVVFIHTQCENINKDIAKKMMESALVFNWTGDVRCPLQQFYLDFGKCITSTLFTNMNDVETLLSSGITSDYLQVGFDSVYFNPIGKTSKLYPEIIFLGSNYPTANFPLTQLRYDMVNRLKSEFGNNFGVYGGGWGGLESGNITSYEEEGTAYRSCKIAINLSHFAYKRYSSDRMFRILGAGAFCLTHHFPEIEKDFKLWEDVVVWDNLDDLVKKIRFYLNDNNERGRIAMNGCFNARTNFTWHHFAKNLDALVDKYITESINKQLV